MSDDNRLGEAVLFWSFNEGFYLRKRLKQFLVCTAFV